MLVGVGVPALLHGADPERRRARRAACAPASRLRPRSSRSAAMLRHRHDCRRSGAMRRQSRAMPARSTRRPPPTASACRPSSSRTPAAGWPGRSGPTTGAAAPSRRRRAFAAVAEAIAASEPVTMAVSDAQFERCRAVALRRGARGRDLHRRRLDARHRADLRRRRRRRRGAGSTGASTPGAASRAGSTSPGTATTASPRKVLEIEGRRPLPRAARARGRLDPRRRRGHGADHRGVPAQPATATRSSIARADRGGRCATTSAPRR